MDITNIGIRTDTPIQGEKYTSPAKDAIQEDRDNFKAGNKDVPLDADRMKSASAPANESSKGHKALKYIAGGIGLFLLGVAAAVTITGPLTPLVPAAMASTMGPGLTMIIYGMDQRQS